MAAAMATVTVLQEGVEYMQVNRQSLMAGEETGVGTLTVRAQDHKAAGMLKRKETKSGKNPKRKRV